MNHQVNSGSLHPELKSRKGAGSKKKNKKTKEASESSKADADNSSEQDSLERAMQEKLSLGAKREMTNGICCSIHSDSVEHSPNGGEQLHQISDSDAKPEPEPDDDIQYVSYQSELQMAEIMRLIQKDLSEPYSIYTYRYFIHNWPKLCFLAMSEGRCIGAIVCKLDLHRKVVKRGYIAMLAVDEKYRKRKIGSRLVRQAIQMMIQDDADEVVLETEITNKPALRLYENLGFVRDKRLFRYYLNGVDALRLKLWLR